MYTKEEVYDQALEAAKAFYRGGGNNINPDTALRLIHEELTKLNEAIG